MIPPAFAQNSRGPARIISFKMTDHISRLVSNIGLIFSGRPSMARSDLPQEVIEPCFTAHNIGRSFKFNFRQCMDIADYLEETIPFRKEAWERIQEFPCDLQAIMEFCLAIVEAKLFLQDCSSAADDVAKNAYNSLTKLHAGEAYDVLLHNLIWSKASLHLAILYAGADPDIDYSKEMKKQVKECKDMLSRYNSCPIQPRLDRDRAEFYRFVENPPIKLYENQRKRLTFLVQKSKAYSQLQSDGGGSAQEQLNVFKIDPDDIIDHENRCYLGAGASGTVYKMSWLGQTVAVKVFSRMSEMLFTKEASLLAGLQNPYIVHMVGWYEKDGDCMLMMDFASTDLKKEIDKQSSIISLPAAVDIMLQISRGMEYLHKRKVIHRDLKPNNVLLEPSPLKQMATAGFGRVKLCDFGLAKVKEQSAENRSQFTSVNVGTSYYRAPEVLLDDEVAESRIKYTLKADVFSFAITCFETLVGRIGPSCYAQLTSRKALRELMVANVRPTLPPVCPPVLARLITSCWDTHPMNRPRFSQISNSLISIKLSLMRVSDVERGRYIASADCPVDVEEDLMDEEFEPAGSWRSKSGRVPGDEDLSIDALDLAGERTSLKSGESLKTNQLITCNGYKLIMQGDGNLVLKSPSQSILWASSSTYDRFRGRRVPLKPPSCREAGCTCTLRSDGNLVISDWNGQLLWQSNTSAVGPHTLRLHGDGRLSLTNHAGLLIWTA